MSLQTDVLQSTTMTQATGVGIIQRPMPRLPVIRASGALVVLGTSSSGPTQVWEAPREADHTASGPRGQTQETVQDSSEATRGAVSELRLISGLTWDQLGQLFEVSRRSVHFWASGKPLNANNEGRLMRVLDIVRTADRGDARSTRTALFEVEDGVTPFDLLTSQRFDEAQARLGRGPGRRRPKLTELSAKAKAARAPLSPEELIEARHERVHSEVGRARAVQAVRNKRRGTF